MWCGPSNAPCTDYVLVRDWQLRLRKVLQEQGFEQCKSDRRLFIVTSQLIVLVYVDDLLLIGCPTTSEKFARQLNQKFARQLNQTFPLKHTTTL